jgi:diguanylate cyclase (GGDEF)-like protein
MLEIEKDFLYETTGYEGLDEIINIGLIEGCADLSKFPCRNIREDIIELQPIPTLPETVNIVALEGIHLINGLDQLTQLEGRAVFDRQLAKLFHKGTQILSHEDKRKSNSGFVVLFVDANGLKDANNKDHQVGDHLLKTLANRLKASVRIRDGVYRIGGDEFIVLLEDIKEEGISGIIKRILEVCDTPIECGNYTLSTSVSIGIAVSSSNYDSPGDMVLAADQAMTVSKDKEKKRCQTTGDTRKSTVLVADEQINERFLKQQQLETHLRQISEGKVDKPFRFSVQPIYTSDKQIVGYEVLTAITNPNGESDNIRPKAFIETALKIDRMSQIGEKILEAACSLHKQLKNSQNVYLSINLSHQELEDRDKQLIQNIQKAINTSGIPANKLRFEINVNSLYNGQDKQSSLIKEMLKLGVDITIDNLGANRETSLSDNLVDLCLQYPNRIHCKIDPSVITQINEANDDLTNTRLKTKLRIICALGADVTVVGVETREQAEFLNQFLGIYLQGNYLQPPQQIPSEH